MMDSLSDAHVSGSGFKGMSSAGPATISRIRVSITSTATRADAQGSSFTTYVLEIRADITPTAVPFTTVAHQAPASPSKSPPDSELKKWVVEHRYSEFARLHNELKNSLPQLRVLPFPSKTLLYSMSASTIRHRQQSFQAYLDVLLRLQPLPDELLTFLDCAEFTGNRNGAHAHFSQQAGGGAGGGAAVALAVADFTWIKAIGKGSFGKVFMVRPVWANGTGPVYAMKVMRKVDVKRRNQVAHTMAERRIMASVRHPFVVPLLCAFQTSEKLYMVTEYCPGGELFFHLKRLKRFKEREMKFYVAEIGCALAHLHGLDIIYRDLKPENILLDSLGHVKLTDFGLSKDQIFGDRTELEAMSPDSSSSPSDLNASISGAGSPPSFNTRTFCGTPEYLAPEMILNRKRATGYGQAVDWWSLGIVAFEMLAGSPPFYDRNFNVMCEKILRKPVKLPPKCKVSEAGAKFICEGLLVRDPSRRLGAATSTSRNPNESSSSSSGFARFQQHPFFEGLDWLALTRRELPPPFVPSRSKGGKPEDDVKNVDKEFLKMSAVDTPLEASALDARTSAAAGATGTSSGSQDNPTDRSSGGYVGRGSQGSDRLGSSRGDSVVNGDRSESESTAAYGAEEAQLFQDFSFVDASILG